MTLDGPPAAMGGITYYSQKDAPWLPPLRVCAEIDEK